MKLIRNLCDHDDNQEVCVRTEKGDTEPFGVGQGVRQGCILSPTLFDLYAEFIIRRALDNWDEGLSIGDRKICNLWYADDTTIIGSN